jgi:hypothetical protein
MLTDEFPEVPQAFDKNRKGLLHCEMGAFAGLTEKAMDGGEILAVGIVSESILRSEMQRFSKT